MGGPVTLQPRRRGGPRDGARHSLAAFALVLLGAGAAAGQGTGSLVSPAVLPSAGAAAGQDPRSSGFAADPLAGYVREALTGNLELRQQRLMEARAAEQVTESRGRFIPSLSLQARYSGTTGVMDLGQLVNPAYAALNRLTGTTAFPTNISATLPYRRETMLHLQQPILQPALVAGHSLQRSLSALETARTAEQARRLGAQVRAAYLGCASAARVVELYQATLPVLDENVRVNERLVANGKATPDAVLRARAERATVAQQLMDAERQRDAAFEYFDFLLDRPLDAPVALLPDSVFEEALPVTLDGALTSARAHREELTQADLGVRAAKAQGRLAAASFLPSLALAGDYGFQGQTYRFDKRDDVAIASLVLQWNLFNGGQDAARRSQASLDRDRAELRRQEATRQVALEVEQAWRAADVAWRAIATARERLAAARRGFELVQRRYVEGVATQLEFLDARAAYTGAAVNEVLSRYEYATRRVELVRAAALGPALP